MTEKNKYMEYVINKEKLTLDQRVVICLEGSTTAQLRFLSDADIIESGNVKCVNIAYEEDEYFGKFEINKASVGEYLTLSVHAKILEEPIKILI